MVFAGGTCISKAHGLISRMAEDIDIKVLLAPTEKPLKKGAGDRPNLQGGRGGDALHGAGYER